MSSEQGSKSRTFRAETVPWGASRSQGPPMMARTWEREAAELAADLTIATTSLEGS